jgi:hypothetical protein
MNEYFPEMGDENLPSRILWIVAILRVAALPFQVVAIAVHFLQGPPRRTIFNWATFLHTMRHYGSCFQ